jgi:ferredoxin-type protein NapF
MTSSALSKIRIIFSVVVLILFVSVFIDFRHIIPNKYFYILTSFQFIPSGYKFLNTGTLAASGFIVVLLLTILSGRTYCSFLCPLGILQDVFSRAGGRVKKKFRRFGFKKASTLLRYSILVLVVIFTLVWGGFLLTIFDPYSIFGRLMTYFVRPLLLIANNFLSGILGRFDIYTLVNTPQVKFPLAVYIIPSAFLLLTGILSFIRGRLFCNSVCPVGTFLGLISKISIFRINFDDLKCTRCGRCSLACKSSCIDFLNKDIDVSRCVDCFNCLKSCPEKAISYGVVKLKKKENENETDPERRKVIAGSALFLLGLSGSASGQTVTAPKPTKASTVKEDKKYPVCPPGSMGIENFTKNCTACSLCISVCPNNVLIPSVREYGLSGIMQPRLDFHKSFCTYECTKCLAICPTGALMPLETEAKKLTQIGKAVFIKENCIVKTEKTACGACSESCPTKAVHMIPFEGKLVIPETKDELCIGCGHCEFACPTTPYKAIFVDGNPEHKAAKKPENVKSEVKKPVEFPF